MTLFRCPSPGKNGADRASLMDVFPGPGHICHTGYRHWWVDEEWSVKARHDGVFRYAPNCKIEHLHPTWGKGQQDETYAIGWKHGADDADLYQRRYEHAKTQGWA